MECVIVLYLQFSCAQYVLVLISLWLSKRILFFQDTAAPHKAAVTHQKLAYFRCPAYSPDLAPSDYLFIRPKTLSASPPMLETRNLLSRGAVT
jgi:hypothetical protein